MKVNYEMDSSNYEIVGMCYIGAAPFKIPRHFYMFNSKRFLSKSAQAKAEGYPEDEMIC